jgi:hypothetical protein
MPGLESTHGFDFRIDQISKKVQEIREKKTDDLDTALGAVERNGGRTEAREATMSLLGLADELKAQQGAMHRLDPAKVADLISDPFED